MMTAQQFCLEVKELAEKYNLSCFMVTNGASLYHNNGCEAVKYARESHIKWEIDNDIDSDHNWNK